MGLTSTQNNDVASGRAELFNYYLEKDRYGSDAPPDFGLLVIRDRNGACPRHAAALPRLGAGRAVPRARRPEGAAGRGGGLDDCCGGEPAAAGRYYQTNPRPALSLAFRPNAARKCRFPIPPDDDCLPASPGPFAEAISPPNASIDDPTQPELPPHGPRRQPEPQCGGAKPVDFEPLPTQTIAPQDRPPTASDRSRHRPAEDSAPSPASLYPARSRGRIRQVGSRFRLRRDRGSDKPRAFGWSLSAFS